MIILCEFDNEGNRISSVDATFSTDKEIAEYKNNGFIEVSLDDYNKLIGNVDDKEYIYKDGEIIEKPPYIPTAEEIQAQKEAELEQEYNTQLESFKNDMLVALLNNNDDAIKSIQEEILEFNAAYVEAKEEIKADA